MTPPLKKPTIIVMIGAVVALVGYDIFAFVEPSDGDTISEVTQEGSFDHAGIPFALGALLGHFLIPTSKKRPAWLKWSGLGALVAGSTALFFVRADTPILFALAGILCGATAWPLHRVKK